MIRIKNAGYVSDSDIVTALELWRFVKLKLQVEDKCMANYSMFKEFIEYKFYLLM